MPDSKTKPAETTTPPDTSNETNPPTSEVDDRPQREDEYLSDFLQDPSPEHGHGEGVDAVNEQKKKDKQKGE